MLNFKNKYKFMPKKILALLQSINPQKIPSQSIKMPRLNIPRFKLHSLSMFSLLFCPISMVQANCAAEGLSLSDLKSKYGFYLFISQSLSDLELKEMFILANSLDEPLYLKGLAVPVREQQSAFAQKTSPTSKDRYLSQVANVAKEFNLGKEILHIQQRMQAIASKYKLALPTILLDAKLFEKYQVEQVPLLLTTYKASQEVIYSQYGSYSLQLLLKNLCNKQPIASIGKLKEVQEVSIVTLLQERAQSKLALLTLDKAKALNRYAQGFLEKYNYQLAKDTSLSYKFSVAYQLPADPLFTSSTEPKSPTNSEPKSEAKTSDSTLVLPKFKSSGDTIVHPIVSNRELWVINLAEQDLLTHLRNNLLAWKDFQSAQSLTIVTAWPLTIAQQDYSAWDAFVLSKDILGQHLYLWNASLEAVLGKLSGVNRIQLDSTTQEIKIEHWTIADFVQLLSKQAAANVKIR